MLVNVYNKTRSFKIETNMYLYDIIRSYIVYRKIYNYIVNISLKGKGTAVDLKLI